MATERDKTKASTMAVTNEVELLIEKVAYKVADEVCKRYDVQYRVTFANFDAQRQSRLDLHEANCPGRRVGKGVVVVLSGAAGAIGTGCVLLIRLLLQCGK